jgi:hypothetical protein
VVFQGDTGITGTKQRIAHNTWTIQVAQEIKPRLTLTIGKRQVRSFAMFGIDGEDRGNEGNKSCLANQVKRESLINRLSK